MKKEVTKRNIQLVTADGKDYWGYVMLEAGQRLQDVVNDDRKFLPIFLLYKGPAHMPDEFKMRLVKKDFINYIEDRGE